MSLASFDTTKTQHFKNKNNIGPILNDFDRKKPQKLPIISAKMINQNIFGLSLCIQLNTCRDQQTQKTWQKQKMEIQKHKHANFKLSYVGVQGIPLDVLGSHRPR